MSTEPGTVHDDVRAALFAASEKSAWKRAEWRIQAATARQSLPETLALHPERVDPDMIRAWVHGLDDDAVMIAAARLQTDGDLRKLDRVAREMLAEAVSVSHK